MYEGPIGLIVPACLFFNCYNNMLFLSKYYMTSIYWLPQDDLIGKFSVKSAHPRSFGAKGARTAEHLCVFVGSSYGNTYSKYS